MPRRVLGLTLYLRLIVLTAGTLLPLFWMIVILGHRRQRNFERVFFFLCLSLVFFFGGSLLAQNAHLYYGFLPQSLEVFCRTVTSIGLGFLPSLLIHLHIEYATIRGLPGPGRHKRLWVACAYLPMAFCLYGIYRALQPGSGFDFEVPSRSLGLPFRAWMPVAIGVGAFLQSQFKKSAPDTEQKAFHRALAISLFLVGLVTSILHLTQSKGGLVLLAEFGALLPLVWLIWDVEKFNFLQIGRQRNLIYAVFVTFLALLYLSFVRRVSTWTEAYLPPEATAAILLFVPLIFFEPLQRLIRRRLQATAQSEVDRAQRLMGPILEVARLGNFERLRSFIEQWVSEQLQLANVRLSVKPALPNERAAESHASSEETFSIRHAGSEIGSLR